MSAISGENLIERYFDDVSTIQDAFLRGASISGKQQFCGNSNFIK